jgi:DNA invertase Pin-like site-specific DNA recombinase
MRVCIYARFSTDKQRDTSIEDQARGCRTRAEREGWTIVAEHSDAQTSGSTPVALRAGGKLLLADVLAQRMDVLLLEGLDRLSRDIGEQDRIVKRIEHRRIRIIGIGDGYDSQAKGRKVMAIARGMVNEIYLDDLRFKTHRGLAGQVENGLHAGGLSFGYRSLVAGVNARGEPTGHKLEIDEARAPWVRWIFEHYAEGWSCQRIAAELNQLRAPAPRGGTWCVSAIYGSPHKGSGIVNNELYVGRYVWNRSQWIKDPETGRRQRIDRPADEWKVDARPHLRIIDDALWGRVRARMNATRLNGGRKGKGASPRTLFGGLMTCGECGGAIVAVDTHAYGCAAHKDRGRTVCAGVQVSRKATEARLLSTVREDLLGPAAIARLQQHVREIQRERTRVQGSGAEATARRLAELEREIPRLVDAVVACGISDSLRERLAAAEAERAALKAVATPAPGKAAIADVMLRHRRMVADLQGALKRDTPRARDILRELMPSIKVVREGESVFAEISTGADRVLLAAGGSLLGMVAGTCNPTQRRVQLR